MTQHVARELDDPLSAPVAYYLARATVQAALVWFYERKQADFASNEAGWIAWRIMRAAQLKWYSVPKFKSRVILVGYRHVR